MIMINLLPHREERRKRRKIAFFAGLGVAAVAGLAMVGVWYLIVGQLVAGQQQRNAFLQGEIGKLDVQIKDIASLKSEIASLKARQKAVEDLQIDRNVPVHVLNELVRQPRNLTAWQHWAMRVRRLPCAAWQSRNLPNRLSPGSSDVPIIKWY